MCSPPCSSFQACISWLLKKKKKGRAVLNLDCSCAITVLKTFHSSFAGRLGKQQLTSSFFFHFLFWDWHEKTCWEELQVKKIYQWRSGPSGPWQHIQWMWSIQATSKCWSISSLHLHLPKLQPPKPSSSPPRTWMTAPLQGLGLIHPQGQAGIFNSKRLRGWGKVLHRWVKHIWHSSHSFLVLGLKSNLLWQNRKKS